MKINTLSIVSFLVLILLVACENKPNFTGGEDPNAATVNSNVVGSGGGTSASSGSASVGGTSASGGSASSGISASSTLPAPVITGLSLNSSALAGGALITISGSNFVSGTAITINGVSCAVQSQSVSSISCLAGQSTAGTFAVIASNPNGQVSSGGPVLTYHAIPPVVLSLSASSGTVLGGSHLMISGSGFNDTCTVQFGTYLAVINSLSATSINVTSPAVSTPGPTSLSVNCLDGSISSSFNYLSAPSITSVSPNSVSASGGTPVTISGNGFLSGATVKFGSIQATSTAFTNSTQLVAVFPAGAVGPVSVTVINPDGQSSPSSVFTFIDQSSSASCTPDSGTPISSGSLNVVSAWSPLTPSYTMVSNVGAPQIVSFNSQLYIAWNSLAFGTWSAYVGVFNGNDTSSGIAPIQNGLKLNKNTAESGYGPQLTVFDCKLYATWYEDNGTAFQIRAAVYNSNDLAPQWTFIDGNGLNGLNFDPTKNASVPKLIPFQSKLYATWTEVNSSGVTQIRLAVYNGNDGSPSWKFVDDGTGNGINKNPLQNALNSELIVFNSELYAAWEETNANSVSQIRMAVYNGNDASPTWNLVDGNGSNGINHDAAQSATTPSLTILNAKLYAMWTEGTPGQIRAAVYSGNDASPAWSFIDGNSTSGINHQSVQSATAPQMTVFNSRIYATWVEAMQTRIAFYDGDDLNPQWIFADGPAKSLNVSSSDGANNPFIGVFNSKLYAAWAEGTSGASVGTFLGFAVAISPSTSQLTLTLSHAAPIRSGLSAGLQFAATLTDQGGNVTDLTGSPLTTWTSSSTLAVFKPSPNPAGNAILWVGSQGTNIQFTMSYQFSADQPPWQVSMGYKVPGSSALCTELYHQGLLDKKIWEADMEFGSTKIPNETRERYLAWATTVANAMHHSKLLTWVMKPFIKGWAYQMAFHLGAYPEPNRLGGFLEIYGTPLSNWIGEIILHSREETRKTIAWQGK